MVIYQDKLSMHIQVYSKFENLIWESVANFKLQYHPRILSQNANHLMNMHKFVLTSQMQHISTHTRTCINAYEHITILCTYLYLPSFIYLSILPSSLWHNGASIKSELNPNYDTS